MTPEIRAWILAQILRGSVLRLTVAGGEEYQGAGYYPHSVVPDDITWSDDGTEAVVAHVWTFDGPGPDVMGARLTRGAMTVKDGFFPEAIPVPVAGTAAEGSLELGVN